eukprot:7726767-Alexandrium_andersonii.AAC.1
MDLVQHRHHYIFAAECRMGWLPEMIVVRDSVVGRQCLCLSWFGRPRVSARRALVRRPWSN